MKKFLALSLSAMLAMSANAQLATMSQIQKYSVPEGVQLEKSATAISYAPVAKAAARKAPALNDLSGTYILNYDNYDASFRGSSEFTLSFENGTTVVCDDDFADTEDFEYNVVLYDFTFSGSKAYGYYYEDEGFILVPIQTIATNATYGRIVMSGVVTNDGVPQSYGFNIILLVNEDGSLELYDSEDELIENGWPEGSIISGWYSIMPDYSPSFMAFSRAGNVTKP